MGSIGESPDVRNEWKEGAWFPLGAVDRTKAQRGGWAFEKALKR
jgi:hypothetical protein